MLNQLGFRATGPVRETPDEAARNIVGDISAEVPKPAFDTTMGRAFGAAQKRGFGVAEQPTSPLTSPVSLALDSSKIRQFERAKGMQPANPETRATIKGIGTLGFRPPETEEEKSQREFDKAMRLESGKRLLDANDAKTRAQATAAQARATAGLIKATYRTRDGKPLSDEAAQYAAESGKTPIELGLVEKPMTESERKNLQATWARIGIEQDRANQQGADAATKKRQAQEGLAAMLPTITAAAKDISSWGEKEIKQLSPTAIAALNQASLQGGLTGVFLSTMASQMTSPLDRRYLQYAASVADAVARASEVGVLTNQDINRFRNQVLFIGGEELGDKRFKVNNLKSWANWLATNKGALNSGESGRSSLSLMPGETAEEAQQSRGWQPANPAGRDFSSRMGGTFQRQGGAGAFGFPAETLTQDADYAAAMDAINRGANRASVIARYESQGKQWPGGR
jgi:hypothetical protein